MLNISSYADDRMHTNIVHSLDSGDELLLKAVEVTVRDGQPFCAQDELKGSATDIKEYILITVRLKLFGRFSQPSDSGCGLP